MRRTKLLLISVRYNEGTTVDSWQSIYPIMKLITPTIIALFSITLLNTAFTSPLFATPVLESDSEMSTAGYYRLNWQSNTAGDFVLEESTNQTFSNIKTLYQGPDTATLISGRPNGIYFYRVRNSLENVESGWSNVKRVEVSHHSLDRAFTFFALGAIVFIATLGVVILGNKNST